MYDVIGGKGSGVEFWGKGEKGKREICLFFFLVVFYSYATHDCVGFLFKKKYALKMGFWEGQGEEKS